MRRSLHSTPIRALQAGRSPANAGITWRLVDVRTPSNAEAADQTVLDQHLLVGKAGTSS